MNRIPLRKTAVACALVLAGISPSPAQQEAEVPPGLYSQTIQSETYLERGARSVDVPAGRAAFADDRELRQLDVIPSFLANDRTLAPGLADNLRGCGVYEGGAPAISDQPLQSDFERFDREILNEVDRFLAEGYPPASVLMHAASMGVAIDRAIYAAVRAQPGRADELYTTALELMGFLPGWSCTTNIDRGLYDPVYNVNDLPDQRMVQEVADRYFQQSSRLGQFPDWPNNEFHMLASTTELLDLVSRLETEYWYRPGPSQDGAGANPRETVLIGLYPDNDQIVIDATAERIRQWQAQDKARVPVTFFYNFDYQRPVSRFADDTTLEDIMDSFFEGGNELTPVPLWTVGDYHLEVTGDELEELFELPEADDIDPRRYRALVDDLAAQGFSRKPVLVTLLQSGKYRRVAEPDRVRVALDQGIESFPVAVFYHRVDREPCGAAALCFDSLCDAVVCAGGDPNVCLDPAAAGAVSESSFNSAPGGGGEGAPPPEDEPPDEPPDLPPPSPPASPS